jgi:hypothetical protein
LATYAASTVHSMPPSAPKHLSQGLDIKRQVAR